MRHRQMAMLRKLGLAVFTKICFQAVTFYFLENRSASMTGNFNHAAVTRSNNPPWVWVALSLVLCAHMAALAALLPQAQSLPLEPIPEPIMVSLLRTPQAAPQQPMAPVTPIEKRQKPVKRSVKKPISKPVVPRITKTRMPVAPPAAQTTPPEAATSSASAEPETRSTNNKPAQRTNKAAADTQPYQSPSFNAAYLNNPAPHYPAVSRRLGEQGLVLLRVQVTEDGTAGSVELQTGSGSSRLDQAALEAVKKWQFVPAKRGEQPVSASVVVPVRFSIEEG